MRPRYKRKKRTVRGKKQASLRFTVQIVVCGGLLVLLVMGKLLLPSGLSDLRQTLGRWTDRTMDMDSIFRTLGRAAAGEESWYHAWEDVAAEAFALEKAEQEPVEVIQGSAAEEMLKQLRSGADLGAVLLPLSQQDAEPAAAVTVSLPYVYTPENLPPNTSMEQRILGFVYCRPTQGEITSEFGYRIHPVYQKEYFHYGLDIGNVEGTAIVSFGDGTVTAVGESSMQGKYLIIAHGNGVETLYAHCSRITVSSGQEVSKGETVALMGNTGISTGSHLHFEVHKDGVYLNPIYYV